MIKTGLGPTAHGLSPPILIALLLRWTIYIKPRLPKHEHEYRWRAERRMLTRAEDELLGLGVGG